MFHCCRQSAGVSCLHTELAGVNASAARQLLSPAAEGSGPEAGLAGAGMGPVEQGGQCGCPGRDEETLSLLGAVLCPGRTRGAGRDGAAVVSNADKERAVYHLTSCGVMNKLLPLPVFSAPGRGSTMPHIKAATRDHFQRKRLYVPKPRRLADPCAAQCDKSTRAFPSAEQGSQ